MPGDEVLRVGVVGMQARAIRPGPTKPRLGFEPAAYSSGVGPRRRGCSRARQSGNSAGYGPSAYPRKPPDPGLNPLYPCSWGPRGAHRELPCAAAVSLMGGLRSRGRDEMLELHVIAVEGEARALLGEPARLLVAVATTVQLGISG